jgi:hypothetical protein
MLRFFFQGQSHMCCAISTTKWFWQSWAGAEPKMHLGQSSEIPMGGFLRCKPPWDDDG